MSDTYLAFLQAWWRRKAKLLRGAQWGLPVAVLAGLLAVRLSGAGWVEWIQHKAFDAFQILKPRPYEEAPVRIVDIDDESLARLGQWPWPRTLLARLVRRLNDLGASAVALDMVFPEPDRTSPARVLALWPELPDREALRRRFSALPDHDQVLGRAFAAANVVAGFILTAEKNGVVPAAKASFAFGGDGPLAYLDDYPGAVTNISVLEKAAAGNGGFGFLPEHDLIIRRAPLLFRRGRALLPSLSAEALRVAQGSAGFAVKSAGASGERAFGAHTGISRVKIGSLIVPTDAKGAVWVYFTPPAPRRTVAAWRVLEKGFERSLLEGSIVFLGTSASGLKDVRATPLSAAVPGVEVHANAAEQVLLGRFLSRPDWAPGAEFLYMLVLGAALILLLPRMGAAWCAPLAAGGALAALGFSWQAFSRWSFLVDPVFPVLAVLAVYMTSSLVSYLRSESDRRQIKGAFSRYMSPALVEQLARHPERLRLGGETREMSFHFCDIRGFTTISEQFDPHGLTQFINRFLTPMTELILEHDGVIDKYMGDCIMAFWNAPLDDPDHAKNACRAALAMHARLRALNEEWRAEARAQGRKLIPIRVGTGLNTGPCVVGNMGSDQRFDYSVLGDDVNLASRLEGQSKTYGVNIVIGPRTRDLAPEFASIELDLIRVKGKTVPARIHALLGGPEIRESPSFRRQEARHDRLLAAYRAQDWARAKELLAECRRGLEWPLEGLYALYAHRIESYEADSPGPGWDGTHTATSK